MPDRGVYVIVVGHNLEAKCDVANALASKKELFKPFTCKTKPVQNPGRTVAGKNFYIVVTPDLNTPLWTHHEKDLEKFKNKVFLYVQDNDCIDSDDAGSVEVLQERFSKSSPIMSVRYKMRSKRDDRFKCLDESASEEFPQLPVENTVTVNKKQTFLQKCNMARKIIKMVGDSLMKDKTTFEGKMSVDDDKARASVNESSSQQDLEPDVSRMLESVTIREDYSEEEDFRSIGLPNLGDDDWALFRKTLKIGRAKSNHVRVNVVGNQGAGKTSLIKRLHEMDIKCPNQNQPPTEGLEINQFSTRCAIRDGARCWETNIGGYEQELNIQRMAFAIKYAENCTQEKEAVKVEVIEEDAELEIGSDEVEDAAQVQAKDEYGGLIDMKQKTLYLQKVKRWRERSTEEKMYVSYWDFAGQTTYYSTHQAFMAPSAVYVLVIDLTLDIHTQLQDNLKFRTRVLKNYTIEETMKFWISSIKAYTRDEQNGHAPFIIVGTHKDKVTEDEIREKISNLRRVLKSLTQVEFVAIDNTLSATSDTDLETLRNKILNLGLGVIDEEIPAQWINLEHIVLLTKSAGKSLLSFEDIKDFDAKSDMPMKDSTRIEAFLEHEHRRGLLMHFCHANMKDIIILEPTYLANYFNLLLRTRPNYELPSSGLNKDGIVHEQFVLDAASHSFNIPSERIRTIAEILTNIHVMHRFEENSYFVPCLLPHREDRESFKDSRLHEKAPTFKLSLADAFVPPAFFHLLIAALNEERDLTVYKTKDGPRLFNLFVCFCFQRETLWLEVYWHECCIFFELKNYSKTKKIRESGCNKMIEVMEIIQNKIEHILSVYRQDNVQYIFEIECPVHASTFVDLQKASDDGEVMCSDGPEIHSVSWQEISQIFPWSPYVCDDTTETNQCKPTDKDIGRLAKNLIRENAMSLASKLKLPQGNILADRVISEWNSRPDMQRLRLFRTWKERNPEHTVAALLKMLTKRKDYDVKTLTDKLNMEVPYTEEYGIDNSVLDTVPDRYKDLLIASDCIGADYTFLMLELGLTCKEIEIKRMENSTLREIIFKLLQSWRQTCDVEATPRIWINTAKFLEIDIGVIVSKFKDELC